MTKENIQKREIKIGNLKITGIAALAPMAGVTDLVFRRICRSYGASYTVSEMVSAKGIVFGNNKTSNLMQTSEDDHPVAIQIFGNDPKAMSQAAKYATSFNPDMIDINMGCPVPKVNKSGGGCSLMKDPDLCFKIVDAVKNSVNIPVTVKIRAGIDSKNINALEIAKICENAAADAITIHARTQKQMYQGRADYDLVKKIKNSVKIPVIGSGDICSYKDAVDKIENSVCDLLMVGRAALGNPWIFSEINNNFELNISIEEKLNVMLMHAKKLCEYKGEKIGMKEARKHILWYLKGIKGCKEFRKRSSQIEKYSELLDFSNEVLKNFF